MSTVTVTGLIARAGRICYSPSGRPVLCFCLIERDGTPWDCRLWDEPGTELAPRITHGTLATVTGTLTVRTHCSEHGWEAERRVRVATVIVAVREPKQREQDAARVRRLR